MHRSLCVALALIGALGLLVAPRARAQGPLMPATIFPVNQPQTFRYSDAQGFGSITFTDLGPDQTTDFDLLRVNITQNGTSYNGSGIATPLLESQPPQNDLVSFTVVGSNGAAYFYEGTMGLGVGFQGSGSYHRVNDPTQLMTWRFATGALGPGPAVPPSGVSGPSPTLSLKIDRGCGSTYPVSAPMTVTYGSSVNDTITLLDQRPDGTVTLLSNQPVLGGQSYPYATTVALVPGARTLILQDTFGAQVTCSFTGVLVYH